LLLFFGIPYTPAREMIAADSISTATDYNPGSTPSGNMNFVVATACIKMRMTPRSHKCCYYKRRLCYGDLKRTEALPLVKANLIITKPIPSYNQISFCSNLIETVLIERNFS
jgi:imidazolonepropionase